jgi:DNA recombination protein RmuC
MDPIILIAIVVGGLVLLGLFINRKLSEFGEKQKPSDELLEYLKTTNTRLDEQNRQFTDALHKSTSTLNERLDNAAKVIGAVQKNIGEMSEIGRGMRELQDFLQSPKLRGNIGEQVMKDLIGQMFPKSSFNLQYKFKSGQIVDAAIKTGAGILPIDSKFPMENFQKMSKAEDKKTQEVYRHEFRKDIRKHIKDISGKYILPEEGTMDFALMYIPSEPVYYEVVNSNELMNLAQKSRVYPVSPTTLYAHLQTILLSFEGQKIESQARKVFTMLRAVQKDYTKVEENLSTLQSHLNNAYNRMSSVLTSFTQLGQKISSTQSLGEGVSQKELPEEN